MPKQKDRYSIEELIKTFEQHTCKAEENQKELVKSFKENNPGKPLPHLLKDSFNICRAFLTFSREIKDIKEDLKNLKLHS
jgi:hypothetical protein